MSKITYYVATTLDGFICGENDEIDTFSQDPELVKHYQEALGSFGTTIMGKATYEFGYAYGLPAGQKAYPHMEHYIFSRSIELPVDATVHVVRSDWKEKLKTIKNQSKSDIYLCGGSVFAGYVLDLGMIDEVILKVNPIVLGVGKPLFKSDTKAHLELMESKRFECGVIENHYKVL